MKNLTRNKATTVSLDLGETPDSAPTVKLVHEFGDIIEESLSTTGSATVWSVDLSKQDTFSAGIHKFIWSYTVSAVAKSQTVYINIKSPYITSSEFFERHGELEDSLGDRYDEFELKVRNVINTYCGQDFDFRQNKTLTVDGDGTRFLYLPMRLESLSTLTTVDPSTTGNQSSDITEFVEIAPDSKFFLRAKDSNVTFGNTSELIIVGDWGWPYVPQNITDAADLILEDWANDDSAYRKHGVIQADIDRGYALRFTEGIFGSTGNIDADTLLMDYMRFGLTLI